MKKSLRIIALVLCLAAVLCVLSACGSQNDKGSDQSKSPLIGTWIAQDIINSDMTFNADGTGSLQRDKIVEKMTFVDKGSSFEMKTEYAKEPVTKDYRIDGDTLYVKNTELGIEDAYTRKK